MGLWELARYQHICCYFFCVAFGRSGTSVDGETAVPKLTFCGLIASSSIRTKNRYLYDVNVVFVDIRVLMIELFPGPEV